MLPNLLLGIVEEHVRELADGVEAHRIRGQLQIVVLKIAHFSNLSALIATELCVRGKQNKRRDDCKSDDKRDVKQQQQQALLGFGVGRISCHQYTHLL